MKVTIHSQHRSYLSDVTETKFAVETECMDCKTPITWVMDYEPCEGHGDDEGCQFRCLDCVRKADPYDRSTHKCLHCGGLFTSFSDYAEGCSGECGNKIDDMVERASQAQYDYIETRLENWGTCEGEGCEGCLDIGCSTKAKSQ